jgi:hypothetical protein
VIESELNNIEVKAKSLFEKYHEDIAKQVNVDEFNMKEVQMGLPVARHYWVSRLMFHKQEILKLKKLRKQARQKIIDKIQQDSPVGLTVKTMDSAVDEHPVIQKIDEQVTENELLVEYLLKIEANFRSVSYDISNLIKIIQLETT